MALKPGFSGTIIKSYGKFSLSALAVSLAYAQTLKPKSFGIREINTLAIKWFAKSSPQVFITRENRFSRTKKFCLCGNPSIRVLSLRTEIGRDIAIFNRKPF